MNFERQSFKEKIINEINPEKDVNVCILGSVIDKKDGLIVLDDGSGKVNIILDSEVNFKNLKINDNIRVFGAVMPTDDGFDLRAEIIQDMNRIDMELRNKIIRC